MAEPPQRRLQSLLQAAVQAVHWTYSLFWQFCPQQGIIAWRDGYYNGAIKTRKTVQATEESAEEATLQRSQQLRELYDTLAAGDQERRPSAALSPEDLTESEWFYLMCVSFSFPPGVGLPGKAYVERQHIWLTRANKADSKLFSRAILAESAKIQTVVCIPLQDGILELGTTERVQEDIELIRRVKSFFVDSQNPNPPRPALSGHSTSNPTSSNFYSPAILPPFAPPQVAEQEEEEEEEEEEDEIGFDSGRVETLARPDQNPVEAMQLDMSDQDIRIGSQDDSSNNLHSNFRCGNSSDNHGHGGLDRAAVTLRWPCKDPIVNGDGLQTPNSVEVIAEEDAHYSQTVSSILEHQSNRWSKLSSAAATSAASAFSKWFPSPTCSSSAQRHNLLLDGASQWVLKYILFTLPVLHTKPRSSAAAAAAAAATPGDEFSGNHVLAERRRREKLNERFVILRSMVPFITKMDKASILADTIEYLKQLKKRIQDLESRVRQMEAEKGGGGGGREKRKMRAADGGGRSAADGGGRSTAAAVEVSIIECDALVEISCLHREGLVLEVMHVLGGLGLQVTTVQSSINNATFNAELRAKVKGRKPSIMEVKRTINQIIK